MARRLVLVGSAAALVLALLVGGAGAWIAFAPNTPDYAGPRRVKLPPDLALDAVADSLEACGVLAQRGTFVLVAEATGWGAQVKAGHYAFEAGASNVDLLQTLRKGLQTPVRLTIPPGTTPDVVAAVAARDLAFSEDAFLDALRDTALAASLGTDTTHLFGYMLPETYFFYWQTPARAVVRRVKQDFDAFFARDLAAAADSLGLTKGEFVTMASIVQWEALLEREKPTIAGLYLNRLHDGWRLDADPTVQYALIEREGRKRRLFFRDYKIDHPYNTYRFRGLPPGPINNPPPSTLRAVAHAEDHPYFYMVATGDGGHAFNRTHREHRRDAQAYYRRMRERRREQ